MTALLNKLRTIFLKPDSRFELWLRTRYHRLAATRRFFSLQDWLARRSYRRWKAKQAKYTRPDADDFTHQPKVSFLIEWSAGDDKKLRTTLDSIQSLHGEHWEVLLVGASAEHPMLESKGFRPVSADADEVLQAVQGDYVLFCQPGDRFTPHLLVEFYTRYDPDVPADLYYYDCEYWGEKTSPHPLFKPAIPSPVTMLSCNLLSRGLFRTTCLRELWEGLDHDQDWLTIEYELSIKLCEDRRLIEHIPAVLVAQAKLSLPDSQPRQQVLKDHLSRLGLNNVIVEERPRGTRFRWDIGKPSIAIIIPTRNNRRYLEPLLESILNQENHSRLQIHLVDNASSDPHTLGYYETIQGHPQISIISFNQEFNYSRAINLGVASSESDLVLLLNDDMLPIDLDWLAEMSMWALRSDVGVVGAKLLRANCTIQHAGIIMGLSGFMGHLYLNAPEDYTGLLGPVDWYRQYLALTGACQMVRRELIAEVGGYDEDYRLAFGDIDFCLKVHEQGYRNVFTPFARLYHYEGSSRGYSTPAKDALKGYTEMEAYLLNEDPFFSPNLTYTRIPKCTLKSNSLRDQQKNVSQRKRFYLNHYSF